MRKLISVILSIAFIFALCGCSGETVPDNGTYTMQGDEEKSLATLTLNGSDFEFSYDPLSSYLPAGTYTVEGGFVTATTSDGQYTYVFEVIESTILRFVESRSSDVSVTDPDKTEEIYDGAVFSISD